MILYGQTDEVSREGRGLESRSVNILGTSSRAEFGLGRSPNWKTSLYACNGHRTPAAKKLHTNVIFRSSLDPYDFRKQDPRAWKNRKLTSLFTNGVKAEALHAIDACL